MLAVRPARGWGAVALAAKTLWQVSSPVGVVRLYHQAAVQFWIVKVPLVVPVAVPLRLTVGVVKAWVAAISSASAQPVAR